MSGSTDIQAFDTPGAFLASMTDGFWHNLWFRAPAGTKNGEATDWMGMWLWWFCVAWFVVLMAIMFYFVIRYRRSKVGPVAPASSAHNTPIELAWTVIPSLFLVFMFFKGFWGYIDNIVAPAHATEIKVEAAKWSWRFIYPTGAESRSTKELGSAFQRVFYVPEGKPVQLRIKSADVMHALWIPDFRIKADALPNRYTTLWFESKPLPADAPKLNAEVDPLIKTAAKDKFKFLDGVPYQDHWLFCAEYCGEAHSEMAATVRVVPADIYKKWLDAITDKSDLAPAEYGKTIYQAQCSSCHSVEEGKTNTGPNWTELWGNPSIPLAGGGTAVGDANYVRDSVRNPAAKIHAGFPNSMTPFPAASLSDDQLEAIMAYMKYVSKFTTQEVKDEVMRVPATDAAPAK